MSRWFPLVLLLLCAATSFPAMAQDRPLGIYAVPGLFGPEASNCDQTQQQARLPAVRIAPEFCRQFGVQKRGEWGVRFAQQVAVHFRNVRTDLSSPPPPGLDRETVLSETLIATLHVSRADLWSIRKVSTLDVYMPVTLTLMLTNAQTGEVVFSETESTIVQGPMTVEGYRDQAVREFPRHFAKALDDLVATAATRFRPYPIAATVRGRADAFFVVDAGRTAGLREGDFLGADARVRYAEARYALIEPLLGKIAVGQKVGRQVAQPVESLRKPSALVFVSDDTAGLPGDYLTTLLEDALGETTLAVAPLNPSFARIRDDAIGNAGVPYRPRSLPDYFVRLSIIASAPAQTDTNVRTVRRRVQEARALIEVLDRQGRVVFASQGVGRTVDEVVDGMTFQDDQRLDTVVRNAIIDAAGNIAKGFRPQRLRLAAGPGKDGVSLQDPANLLGPGQRGLLVRKVGVISGVADPVWRPLADIEVTAAAGGRADGRLVGLAEATVRSGDELAYDSSGAPGGNRFVVAPCQKNGVDQRGDIAQPGFGAVAANAFAGAFPGAVYFPDVATRLEPRLRGQFDDLDRLGLLRTPVVSACFQAVHKVAPVGEQRSGQALSGQYEVTVGFILLDGERRVGAAALQSTLTATPLPVSVGAVDKAASLQMDLAKETRKLAVQAASQLRPGE